MPQSKTKPVKFKPDDFKFFAPLGKGQHWFAYQIVPEWISTHREPGGEPVSITAAGVVRARTRQEAESKVLTRYFNWQGGYFEKYIEGYDHTVTVHDWNPETDPAQTVKFTDLKVGKTFRGKRPRFIRNFLDDGYDDRTIVWMGISQVQYDGPSVPRGKHYPIVDSDTFLRWAGEEIKQVATV